MYQLSQRDPRWASQPLGTSNKTIGSHGCLITTIAALLETTPDIVNKKLLAVNGYKDGNLVIWAKIAEAFPGVSVRREWSYNNDDVSANLPVVVQVDGAPIGAPMHFVVYIGNQQLLDPWDGQVKPTSTYNAVSYAVIKGQWKQEQQGYYKGYNLHDPESMKVAVDLMLRVLHGEYVDAKLTIDPAILKTQVEATSQCQTQLKTALEQNEKYQEENAILQEENKILKKKYDEELAKNIDLNKANATISHENQDSSEKAYSLEKDLDETEKIVKEVASIAEVKYDKNDKDGTFSRIKDRFFEWKETLKALPAAPPPPEPPTPDTISPDINVQAVSSDPRYSQGSSADIPRPFTLHKTSILQDVPLMLLGYKWLWSFK